MNKQIFVSVPLMLVCGAVFALTFSGCGGRSAGSILGSIVGEITSPTQNSGSGTSGSSGTSSSNTPNSSGGSSGSSGSSSSSNGSSSGSSSSGSNSSGGGQDIVTSSNVGPGSSPGTPIPISKISGFSITATVDSATLSWTNPTTLNAIVVRASSLGVPASPTSGLPVYQGTSTSVTHTGLEGASRYYYAVFVKGDDDRFSDPVTGSVMTKYAGVLDASVVEHTLSVVSIYWNQDLGRLGSIVARRSTVAFPTTVTDGDAATVLDTLDGLRDTTLDAQKTYYYSIFSISDNGVVSDPVHVRTSTATNPPAFTGMLRGVGTVALTYSVPLNTYVSIHRIIGPAPTEPTDNGVLAGQALNHFTDTGIEAGTLYTYFLYAVDIDTHVASTIVSKQFRTNPPQVAGFTVTTPTNTTAHLTWNRPTFDGFDHLALRVLRDPLSIGDTYIGTEEMAISNVGGTSFDVTGLDPTKPYAFVLDSYDNNVDDNGNPSPLSTSTGKTIPAGR